MAYQCLNGQLGRREFLKKATQAAAAVAVSAGMSSAAAAEEKKNERTEAIPIRTLGKTGLKLPILGYGGAALPKAWLNPLSHEKRIELVRHACHRPVQAGGFGNAQIKAAP